MDGERGTVRIEGRYANYFEVSYTANEFRIDLGQFESEIDRGHVHTRIFTTPAAARVLSALLSDVVKKYEAEIGAIERLPAANDEA